MLTKKYLENLYKKYNKPELISPDPLQFVFLYKTDEDREIAALIASSFAYGNVKQILKTLDRIFSILGKSPKKFLLQTDKKQLSKLLKGFKYRFTDEQEAVSLLIAIKETLKKYGSLENCFYEFYQPKKDYTAALRGFAAHLRSYGKIDSLIPNPAKGSALKRLNLCLRWCVRRDAVDIGCWRRIPPSSLLVPLDVHMHRAALAFGLTKRKQADLKSAREISDKFAKFCPQDPVKYDFCLTRFGIREDMQEKDLLISAGKFKK